MPGTASPSSLERPCTNADVELFNERALTETYTRSPPDSLPTSMRAAGATVTVAGGPDNRTYTATTNASGVASLAVPPTTAANPYTVQAVKGASNTVSAANVTSLASGATATRGMALTPVKTLTLRIRRGPGSTPTDIPDTLVTVSLTGPPNGAAGSLPAYQYVGTTNASSQVVLSVPTRTGSTSSTYSVKVFEGSTCSGSVANRRRSMTLNVTAGTGSQSATVVLTQSTCPTLP